MNPHSLLIVGDVNAPQGGLSDAERMGLAAANGEIRENCDRVGAHLAGIYAAFQGHEDEYLCRGIEPTLKGAETIARLFREVYEGNT